MDRQERVRVGCGTRTVNHPSLAGFDDQVLSGTVRANSNRMTWIRWTSCAGTTIRSVREFVDPCVQIQARTGVHDGLET